MRICMGILASLFPFLALAADVPDPGNRAGQPAVDELYDWLGLTGVDRSDLERALPGDPLPTAAALASDPLLAPWNALELVDEVPAGDPVAALTRAWRELGHPVAPADTLDPAPPLAPLLTTRKDRARVRKLDPALVDMAAALADLAGHAAALDALHPDHVVLLDALARPGEVPESDVHRLTDALLLADLGAAQAHLSVTALQRLLLAAATLPTATWPEEAVVLPTAHGRVWLGTPGDDTFDAPFVAVLDPGGDDDYRGDGAALPFSAILDLHGDDSYRNPPTAVGGIALLIDLQGDDDYRGGPGSLGAGLWGCGLLFDLEGRDTYRAGPWSQGVGLAGVGLLLDVHGDDLHLGQSPTQGVGGPRGFGAHVDASGDDTYTSHGDAGAQGHGLGPGPWLAGGLGLLTDLDGHDTYRAGARAQGSAVHAGLGIAADRGGDDHRTCTDRCQGSADHHGLGLLADGGGHDAYLARHDAQAAASDHAIAGLWDLDGHDRYLATGRTQAHAADGAFALLWDPLGDDAYHAIDPLRRWGHTDPLRGDGAVAALLDLTGDDTYGPDTAHADGLAHPASRHGLALDHRLPVSASIDATPARAIPEPATDAEVSDLLHVAARWAQDPGTATAARHRLVAAGPGLYPALRAHLHPDHPATAHPIEVVLLEMAAVDPAWGDALDLAVTADLTAGVDDRSAAHLLVWAGKLPGDIAPEALRYLDHEAPEVRRAAAAVLEEGCREQATEALIQSTTDVDATVRAAATRSLGGCAFSEAIPPLASALADEQLVVRDAASASLVDLARSGLRSDVLRANKPLLAGGNIAALDVAIRIPDASTLPALELLLTHPGPGIRAHAALALGAVGSHAARKALMGREAVEGDSYVLWCLDRALRTPGNGAAMVPELE
jgi:hypothetical protein